MLRECRSHGYFREKECPECGDKGKFLMNDDEIDRLGRIMAGILRHFPDRFNLEMEPNGWINIHDMIDSIRAKRSQFHWLRAHHIRAVVETDAKGRYQIDSDRIRATYGHSIDVDLDLPTDDIPDVLYYPATEEEADIILEVGLKPSDRKKVHLSRQVEDAVMASAHRVSEPIILEIDTAKAVEEGHVIMQAGKTVFITDEVPPVCLKRSDVDISIYKTEKAEDKDQKD
jgi:putative RNA 2'-phosphotransferase